MIWPFAICRRIRGESRPLVAIYDALRPRKTSLPIPLKQLAEIRDFNVFVTTPLTLPGIALNEVRFTIV